MKIDLKLITPHLSNINLNRYEKAKACTQNTLSTYTPLYKDNSEYTPQDNVPWSAHRRLRPHRQSRLGHHQC